MRRRRRPSLTPNTTINVTSLLDITFVLLLTFMVVAPATRTGVPLDLPRVRDVPVLRQEKPLTVSVRQDGLTTEAFFQGKPTSLDDLTELLRGELARNPNVAVTLEGDRATDWEQVARVLQAIRQSGIQRIGILTKPHS